MRRRGQRGQELVEFALVAPILFLLVLGAVDLLRAVQFYNTAADAARQGARQAVANATATDQPFGASNGQPCSGSAVTSDAAGSGCLTDARVGATATGVLGALVSSTTIYTAQPASCPAPPAGQASICVYPAQAARSAEWTNLTQAGSFLVSVTVVVRYTPTIGLVASLFPPFLMVGTTSMVAEY
jgi:Flp pilus assembly protein TadG